MNAFFVGIGGMGMSGLAKLLFQSEGNRVAGSDRNLGSEYCLRLKTLGIPVYPQDGKGPKAFLDFHNLQNKEAVIVKSTAVEDQVCDIVSARELGIPEIMRSDLLSDLFHRKKGIAVGGTAGKTTTTALIAWMLKFTGSEPSCAVGGIINGLETNAFNGKGPYFVIEADESDGSIVKYSSFISIITNVSKDHKSLEELNELFKSFGNNTAKDGYTLLCADDPNLLSLKPYFAGSVVTFGLSPQAQVHPERTVLSDSGSSFFFEDTHFSIGMPGKHNLQNALAAITVARLLGIPMKETSAAIKAFPGIKRRFERVGTVKGVTVIDDFAHNPVEIAAAIQTARHVSKRRFIVYQPHGFGPARFTRNELVEVFSSLDGQERLYLDDIYYGGGTVEKDISSKELAEQVKRRFPDVHYMGDRKSIVQDIVKKAQSGDLVLVMGARDVNQICKKILESLKSD